jgi:hypothetical protein
MTIWFPLPPQLCGCGLLFFQHANTGTTPSWRPRRGKPSGRTFTVRLTLLKANFCNKIASELAASLYGRGQSKAASIKLRALPKSKSQRGSVKDLVIRDHELEGREERCLWYQQMWHSM